MFPRLASSWTRIVEYPRNHLNDFCLFKSDAPDRFACGEKAWDVELPGVHAAELVEAGGRWHIARVSGAPEMPGAPKAGGWIEIARIEFAE